MKTYDYDLIVIGGGAAGLTSSGIGASVGAKTLMIEAKKLGGDCTWYGCVPSKILLKAAKVVHQTRNASQYGLTNSDPVINFSAIIDHVHAVRDEVYNDADHPDLYKKMGIDVAFGWASFVDSHTLKIQGDDSTRTVTGRYIVIATGSEPIVPPVQGLNDVAYLTNEQIFESKQLPKHLMVVGGGPIGIEMAQAFRRFGSQVTVIDMLPTILQNDTYHHTSLLKETLEKEGVTFILKAAVKKLEKTKNGTQVFYEQDGILKSTIGDAVLLAVGRKAQLSRLNLPAAGVNIHRPGILVNGSCRTNIRHIYAVGDVTGLYQFTHMSEHMAKVALTNALLKIPMRIDQKHVPWCTYTDPEVAHVGASEKELRDKNIPFTVYKFPYSKIDRAITDGETTGWIRVYAKKFSGKILGADIIGTHAGDLIGNFALAMRNGVSLRNFADTIHPYPTYGLGARRAADQWYIKNQSVSTVKWIKRIFGYRGPLPDLSDPNRIV